MTRDEIVARQEIQRLKQKFHDHGLDLAAIWADRPENPNLEHRRLSRLWDLVAAWRLCPNHRKLVRLGYDYPPMHPDIDPRTDWLRFERWVMGQPMTWNFVEEHGWLLDPHLLNDAELVDELERIVERLAERGVRVDRFGRAPDRMLYDFLRVELATARFPFLAPGTWVYLTADTGRPSDQNGELEIDLAHVNGRGS